MKKIDFDPELLRRMHWDEGKHVIQMAKALGVSRTCIYARMLEYRISWRGRSDAKFLRASKLTTEERRAHTKAAHAAVRGMKRTDRDLESRAQSKQATTLSQIENVFNEAFKENDLFPSPQCAVGIYNIDFAFCNQKIAIEIDPGNWHNTQRKREVDERKDKYLRDNGWIVIRWTGREIRTSNVNLDQIANHYVRSIRELVQDTPTYLACPAS